MSTARIPDGTPLGPDLASVRLEYGQLMSGGGVHVWNTEPDILEIYPLDKQIKAGQRFGGVVLRRVVHVIEEWEEVPRGGGGEYRPDP